MYFGGVKKGRIHYATNISFLIISITNNFFPPQSIDLVDWNFKVLDTLFNQLHFFAVFNSLFMTTIKK